MSSAIHFFQSENEFRELPLRLKNCPASSRAPMGTFAGAYPLFSNSQMTPYANTYNINSPGVQPYEFEVAQIKFSDGRSQAYIYNPSGNGSWNLLRDSASDGANFNSPVEMSFQAGRNGWMLFETHYAVGPCSTLPIIPGLALNLTVTPGSSPSPVPLGATSAAPLNSYTESSYGSQDVLPVPDQSPFACTKDDFTPTSDYYKLSSSQSGFWSVFSYGD